MELTPLGIEGAWLITSPVRSDERGFFREWFRSIEIAEKSGIDFETQQANHSKSSKGVVRGIHYSLSEFGQAKVVSCVSGSILDVVVDLRIGSPTFMKHVKIEITEGDGQALLIGAGLGHAFMAREESTHVTYLLNSIYSPEEEFGINPFDPDLMISWKSRQESDIEFRLSSKDASAPSFKEQLTKSKLPAYLKEV
jgi:dTDP-4-dehydrorhamnose 3,5-epimerase